MLLFITLVFGLNLVASFVSSSRLIKFFGAPKILHPRASKLKLLVETILIVCFGSVWFSSLLSAYRSSFVCHPLT